MATSARPPLIAAYRPSPGDYVVLGSRAGQGRVLLTRISPDGTGVLVSATFANRSDAVSRFEQRARALAHAGGTRGFRRDDYGEYHLLAD